MQVLYNSSQPLPEKPATSEWATAWLQQLSPRLQSTSGSRLLELDEEAKAELLANAQSHPAVAEVLAGLAVIPGMQLVMQCTQGSAYNRMVAQADLGLSLGPEQVCSMPLSPK